MPKVHYMVRVSGRMAVVSARYDSLAVAVEVAKKTDKGQVIAVVETDNKRTETVVWPEKK